MSFLSQHYVAKVEITQVELALPILGLCVAELFQTLMICLKLCDRSSMFFSLKL